ncbi:MAG: translation elongation factor-like protein [Candidatus Methanomethylicia archaeon]|nr:translation elongation factor-like protein [Candidatus Methanomethylicia archaeon]
MSEEKLVYVGRVIHFYPRISVAIVELNSSLSIGDKIVIKGAATNFEQIVESMQIQYKNVERAEAGQLIGLKVNQKVKEKDIIYKKIQ